MANDFVFRLTAGEVDLLKEGNDLYIQWDQLMVDDGFKSCASDITRRINLDIRGILKDAIIDYVTHAQANLNESFPDRQ